MTNIETSAPALPAQRSGVAASPEWRSLLTHFELAPDDFAFIVLLVPDRDWAEACRQALERFLMSSRKKLLAVSFESAGEFRDELAARLLSLKADDGIGAVWVSAATPQAAADYEEWEEAWRIGAGRLNQYRNPLRRQFRVPLIFAGAPWVQVTLREAAPDLWSVRTQVVRIVSPAGNGGEPNSPASQQSFTTEFTEGRAIDPIFALKEAERLRGESGKEMALARLLARAGLGFTARYRWNEAEQALSGAIELHRRYGAVTGELAGLLRNLSDVLQWRTDYEQAINILLEALRIFQQLGDVLGEANCIQSLGDIALRRSQHDEARARYEEALPLHRQVGDVLGEANCIQSLGDIALKQGERDKAKCAFIEALELYERIPEPYSIGWARRRLARVADDEPERQEHIQAARAAWESIGFSDLVENLDEEFTTSE